MGDALGMGGAQRISDGNGQIKEPLAPEPTGWDDLIQAPALDQAHDQEVDVICRFDFVDGDDVGVVHGRQRLGLPLKPLQSFGIAGHFFRQYFDRHFAPQLGVLGAVNLTHTAFAEFGGDTKMREGFTNHEVSVILHGAGDHSVGEGLVPSQGPL